LDLEGGPRKPGVKGAGGALGSLKPATNQLAKLGRRAQGVRHLEGLAQGNAAEQAGFQHFQDHLLVHSQKKMKQVGRLWMKAMQGSSDRSRR
jgi:hypothetical protein